MKNFEDDCVFDPEALAHCTIEDGIYRFVKEDCDFYEGHYKTHVKYLPRKDKWPYVLPLWLINSGYIWEVRKQVKPGARILELGCAAGIAYFGKTYRMTGLDLSKSALAVAKDHYDECAQASANEKLPFLDGVFDAVISSFFWEHLSESTKHFLAGELVRILRPGGKVIFLYDVETENLLINFFKNKNEFLYKKAFLDGDGHIGYHSSQMNENIYRLAGLNILTVNGFEKTFFQSPAAYSKLKSWPGFTKQFFSLAENLGKGWLLYPYTGFMRVLNVTVDRILPRKWARIERVTLQKSIGTVSKSQIN